MADNKNLNPQLIEFKKLSRSFRKYIIPYRSPTFKQCFKFFLSKPQYTEDERKMYVKIRCDEVTDVLITREFLLNLEMIIHSLYKSGPVSDQLSFFVHECGKYLPTTIQVLRYMVAHASTMDKKPYWYDSSIHVISLYDGYCQMSKPNQLEDDSSSSSSNEIGKNPNEDSETNTPDWFKSEFMKIPQKVINILSPQQMARIMSLFE